MLVSLCTEQSLMHMLHMHIQSPRYTHQVLDIYAQFGGYICIWNVFHNNGEVKPAVGCVLVIYKKEMLGLYTYVACWPCELQLECSSHICSVIYVKYVYSAPC